VGYEAPERRNIGAMPKSKSKRVSKQPPPKAKPKVSPLWIGSLFFTMISSGVIIIVVHYLGAFPTGTQPYQLWWGLGLIAGSFVVATQWH
jgi:hypothetical protein